MPSGFLPLATSSSAAMRFCRLHQAAMLKSASRLPQSTGAKRATSAVGGCQPGSTHCHGHGKPLEHAVSRLAGWLRVQQQDGGARRAARAQVAISWRMASAKRDTGGRKERVCVRAFGLHAKVARREKKRSALLFPKRRG